MSTVKNFLVGSGGAYASIVISGLSSTDVVTSTTPSEVVQSAIWNSTLQTWTVIAREYGVYVITASNGTATVNRNCLVDTATDYAIHMGYPVLLTMSNFDNYFTCVNDTYYFAGADSTWTSNNAGQNSTSAISTWTALSYLEVSVDWTVGSESGWDKFYLQIGDETVVSAASGSQSGTATGVLEASQTMILTYSKDNSQSVSPDCASVTNIIVTE